MPLGIAGVLGAGACLSLAGLFAGEVSGSPVDTAASAAFELPKTPSPAEELSGVVQMLADPLPAAAFLVLLVGACLLLGQRRHAVLAVLGPASTDSIVIAMKHLVGRRIHGSLCYPSTHTAHSAAVSMVIALMLTATLGLGARLSAAIVLAAGAGTAIAMGWALVARSVHYGTDTFGGFCVAVATVPVAAYVIDLLGDRLLPEPGHSRSR